MSGLAEAGGEAETGGGGTETEAEMEAGGAPADDDGAPADNGAPADGDEAELDAVLGRSVAREAATPEPTQAMAKNAGTNFSVGNQRTS